MTMVRFPFDLHKLCVSTVRTELPPSSKVLLIENFCLVSPGYWDSFPAIRDTINRYAIPSSIGHIEVVLHQDPPYEGPEPGDLEPFEEFLLDLHEIGLFRKLTITMKGDRNPQAYDDKFQTLRLLGLFETRVGVPSVMYPQSAEIYGH